MEKTKILLVDDDEGVLFSLAKVLEKKGYDVTGVSSAMVALKSVKKSTFDILLTDLKMPEISGIELLKEARKIKPDLGVIIMTGYGEIDTYLEAINLGAIEYLNKPIKSSDLELIIKKVLKEKKKLAKS